jgi:hypothetical protein
MEHSMHRPGPNDLHYSTLVGSPFPLGQRFTFLPEEGSTLLRLEVAGETLIEALRLTYLDKAGRNTVLQAGNEIPKPWHSVDLKTPVAGLGGTSGWYLDSLRLEFRDGSHSLLFGGTGGDLQFRLHLHKKENIWQGEVVGFWGFADERGIEALGLIFWSVEREL